MTVTYDVGTPVFCDEHTISRAECGCQFMGDATEWLLETRVKNGAWLDSQVFPPLQWAVPGLIPEGFGILAGAPKLGKSWLALGVGLAVSVGGRALGVIPVQQRPVLYAALEDGDRRMQDRSRKLLFDEPIPKDFNYLTDATPGEFMQIIEAWLDRNPGGLVMLDTLGRVMPPQHPGESAYQRDYRIGARLKKIVDDRPGSTLLVVHHVRKLGSTDWMDSTSGTNGLNGAADFTILLERSRNGDGGTIRVTGRDVTEGEYAALMDGGVWRIDGKDLAEAAQKARTEEGQAGLGGDSAKIVEFVSERPDGVTIAQVSTFMAWADVKTRNYLKRLTDSGRIRKIERGRYGPTTGSVTCVTSVTFDGSDRPDSPESYTSNTSNTPSDAQIIDLWAKDLRGE